MELHPVPKCSSEARAQHSNLLHQRKLWRSPSQTGSSADALSVCDLVRTILNRSEILRCSLVDMAFCFVCFRDAPQVLVITFPSQVFSGLNALNGLCKSVPKPEAIFMLFLASSWLLLSNHLSPCLSVTFCMLINALTPLRIQSVLVLFCKMNL